MSARQLQQNCDCDLTDGPYPLEQPSYCLIRKDLQDYSELAHPDLGILTDWDGELSNTWADGTRGTDGWTDDGCLPVCRKCGNDVKWSRG